MVILQVIFEELPYIFTVSAPVYISTSSTQGFQFLYILNKSLFSVLFFFK